ncbi:MAG: peptide-methionine (R)-S-oxide reductase [Rhodospirillaceae bacterium]|nr:MAG: peptide-methionine (R)-S-oxide reductase [Rhodospirillaceae bacterium]
MKAFDLRPPDAEEMQRLTADLDGEARRVLLDRGTERPFYGRLLENKQDGAYVCRLCGLPLFKAKAKFESATGWPSFFEAYDDRHITERRDQAFGMERIEILCARCDGHLGHVFPDGPSPTGTRYCLNSVAMAFVPKGKALPDKLGRGDPKVAGRRLGGGDE